MPFDMQAVLPHSEAGYGLVGIGNAMLDQVAHVSEDFLEASGVKKGIMRLVGPNVIPELLCHIGKDPPGIPGGSVANSIAVAAGLGLKTGFMGKLAGDAAGDAFLKDFNRLGINFPTTRLSPETSLPTSRCLSLVTPDGERSMSTHLGASLHLGRCDVDSGLLSSTQWLLIEGYLLDMPDAREVVARCASMTRPHGGQVALSLSDPACIARHPGKFRDLVEKSDLVIGNGAEFISLTGARRLPEAVSIASRRLSFFVCTNGSSGAIIGRNQEIIEVPAAPASPVDATGAGDAFAGGFLFGIINGKNIRAAAGMGCIAAANVISVSGCRPHGSLPDTIQNLMREANKTV